MWASRGTQDRVRPGAASPIEVAQTAQGALSLILRARGLLSQVSRTSPSRRGRTVPELSGPCACICTWTRCDILMEAWMPGCTEWQQGHGGHSTALQDEGTLAGNSLSRKVLMASTGDNLIHHLPKYLLDL